MASLTAVVASNTSGVNDAILYKSATTNISGGILRITNGSGLGTTTSGTVQSCTSTLELDVRPVRLPSVQRP